FLVLFHFGIPFLLLLSRSLKRRARTLGTIALMVLAARVVDLGWIVRPEFPRPFFALHWLDFTLPIALGGVWLWWVARELKTQPLLPLGEPEVQELTAEARA